MTKEEAFIRELSKENINLKHEVDELKRKIKFIADSKTIIPSDNKSLSEIFKERFESIIYSKFPFVSIKFYDTRPSIAIDVRWYYRGDPQGIHYDIDFDLLVAHHNFDDIVNITTGYILEKIAKGGEWWKKYLDT